MLLLLHDSLHSTYAVWRGPSIASIDIGVALEGAASTLVTRRRACIMARARARAACAQDRLMPHGVTCKPPLSAH